MELERPQRIQCVTYAQFCGHKANTRSIAWQTLLKNTWPPNLMWEQERAGYVSYQIPVHKTVVQIIIWLQCDRHLSFHSGCLNSNTYITNLFTNVTFQKGTCRNILRKKNTQHNRRHTWTTEKKCFCFLQKHFRSYCRGHWNFFNTIQNILCSKT